MLLYHIVREEYFQDNPPKPKLYFLEGFNYKPYSDIQKEIYQKCSAMIVHVMKDLGWYIITNVLTEEQSPEICICDFMNLIKYKTFELLEFKVAQHDNLIDPRPHMLGVFIGACIVLGFKTVLGYDYLPEDTKLFTIVAKSIQTPINRTILVNHMLDIEVDILNETLFKVTKKPIGNIIFS